MNLDSLISHFSRLLTLAPKQIWPHLRHGFYLTRLLVQGFGQENLAQVAAALAFTTLLALVPLATVFLSLASVLPIFGSSLAKLDVSLIAQFMPMRSGETISGHVLRFASKARQLTPIGIVLLAFTGFLLLHTIERVFNHIWGVNCQRRLWQRLLIYFTGITAVPLLFGMVAAFLSYAVTLSFGFFSEAQGMQSFFLKISGLLVLAAFLSFLYYAMPSTKVRPYDACLGALLATLAFALVQYGFQLYLVKVPLYSTIYGAFASVPIFLLWLHLSWTVVLLGALLVALLPSFRQTLHNNAISFSTMHSIQRSKRLGLKHRHFD